MSYLRVVAERRRNAERCKREQEQLSRIIAERRAARASEAVARQSIWKSQTIADNERRGLSVGC